MSKATIVVVEDEAIVAMDLRAKLEDLGYAVPGSSHSGEEAVKLVSLIQPDLVLMDIRLSGEMDGVQAAGEIHQTLDIPVVFLTAYADEPTLDRAKQTEPLGYLLKPVDHKSLQTVVELALHKHEIDQRLKDSERWFSAVLSSVSDAVVTGDQDGFVTYMNPAARDLLGALDPDAAATETASILASGSRGETDPGTNPVTEALRTNSSVVLPDDQEVISEAGKPVPVAGTAGPIRNEKQGVDGVVLTFRDITLPKMIEAQMAQAVENAQEAGRMKSQLLSTVSHELNTPLAAIKGFATFLLDNDDKLDQTEKRELLQEIDAASDRLTNLIDHLLEFSRVESGNLSVIPVPTAITDVIDGAISHLKIRASGLELILDIQTNLPPVAVDPRRLRQVLDNLLDNALKYTPESKTVWLKVSQDHANPASMIRLTIRDNGPGISKDQLETVFEPFKQSNRPHGHHSRGFGLGLAICRRIIETHQGRIWAEATTDEGATLIIILPIAKSQNRQDPVFNA